MNSKYLTVNDVAGSDRELILGISFNLNGTE